MYYLLLLTTGVRFVDMIFLLSKDSTNLPVPVIVVTSAMILYGIVLGVAKFASSVRMKQLAAFYMVQSAMIAFNMIYVAVACPLSISGVETLIVGTFLDLLVNVGLIYASRKRMRSFQLPVTGERSMNV